MKDKHWNHIARWTLLTVAMYGQPPRSLWFLFSSHDHPYIHVYVNICIIQSHQGQCGLCLVPMTFSWDRWYSVQNNTTDVDQIIILHTQLEAPPFDRYSYIAMTVQLYGYLYCIQYSIFNIQYIAMTVQLCRYLYCIQCTWSLLILIGSAVIMGVIIQITAQ